MASSAVRPCHGTPLRPSSSSGQLPRSLPAPCSSQQPRLDLCSASANHELQGWQSKRHTPGSRAVRMQAKPQAKGPAPSSPKPAQQQQPEEANDEFEEAEDGFYEDEDEFEYEDLEEGQEGDDGQDVDDDGVLLGLEEDGTQPGVDTGGNSWAEEALRATQTVLSRPGMANLELYVFRALPGGKLDIRLDRLDDTYGSPSIDDIEKFSRMLNLELESRLGTAVADGIALEVSSPGAERALRLPKDLERFAGLPLYVEYEDGEGKQANAVLVLDQLEGESSQWRLADVRANAPAKGRKLSAKQKKMQISIPIGKLLKARVHVDF